MGDNRVLVGLPERLRKAKDAVKAFEIQQAFVSTAVAAGRQGLLTPEEVYDSIESALGQPVGFTDEEPEVGLIDTRP